MVYCAVEGFVPEALFAGIVAAWQDEAPGCEGHRGKDFFVEGFLLAVRPAGG
jgi:hypothetical protein